MANPTNYQRFGLVALLHKKSVKSPLKVLLQITIVVCVSVAVLQFDQVSTASDPQREISGWLITALCFSVVSFLVVRYVPVVFSSLFKDS